MPLALEETRRGDGRGGEGMRRIDSPVTAGRQLERFKKATHHHRCGHHKPTRKGGQETAHCFRKGLSK